jgi:hypothetical protein
MSLMSKLRFRDSCSLRRVAWALNIPMTEAIEMVFIYVPNVVDKKKVCRGIRDKNKCKYCIFYN